MKQGLERETIFGKDFEATLTDLPVDERAFRESAFAHFTAHGLPTPADEDWKYTSLTALAAEDFKLRPASGVEIVVPEGVALADTSARLGEFRYARNGFTALNAALGRVVELTIPKETSIAEPIELNFANVDGAAVFSHVVVVVEAGAKATLVESYTSDGKSLTNAAIQVFVADNANFTHYRVQKESADAFHVGTTEVTVGRASHYDSTNINLGGRLSRHDIELRFTAEGGEAFVDGLYVLSGDQHHDTHSSIDHAVPNCVSHQSYKGVLNDKSRGVFNGKVFVRENASGTDAQQSNKNLLLSNDARIDTKPQLEIFNDDVKCAHGATVGQLEEEELFYLLSRGLNESLARNLLTYGFAEEIVNKIGIESIKKDLDEAVLNRLNTNLET